MGSGSQGSDRERHLSWAPTKSRVEALVDGIFAVSMTLLVLNIKLPESARLESNSELFSHFASVSQSFWVYVLSFVVLAMFWVAHSYQFHLVERLDRGQLWVNFGFLLLTTTVPFTTNLVSMHTGLSAAVTVYACNLSLLGGALLLHIHRLRQRPSLATKELTAALGRRVERRLLLLFTVPLTAAVVAQVAPAWGMRLLVLLVLLHFFPNRSDGSGTSNL
ncbi:MAG: TMEM175 family protein [Mycobacteriales bacterium]